jgi:lipopolysaccharide export system protein LptA
MKKLLILLLCAVVYAQEIEITADKLEADENKKISTLIGNVVIKKGLDKISCDTLEVKFDKENKPTLYQASGDVRFHILTNNKDFKGSAQKLIYNPANKKYSLQGNVKIEELQSKQRLFGETIIIDRTSGKSVIKGDGRRPVKFIFDVKDD